ncbi:response regulator transcription factor [Arthrobacter sp. RAF14]|uniref:response regulator transcription factor n=1 Tax=Arthrobacter sp. RAF14 TaxID=3233051 RepID=UPI003F91FA91
MRILIVDDEPRVREVIADALESEDHETFAVGSGEDALASLEQADPDAIVLDVSLPGVSGLTVASSLRAVGDRTPILMLTARAAVSERVDGLDAGADDYLTKPFDVAELKARVRALLRRMEPPAEAMFSHDDFEFDPVGRTGARGGRPLAFTATEAALLELFMSNPGQVLPRSTINEHVWGTDYGARSNSLTVYIGYLRQKLEAQGGERLIHTAQGLGYRFGSAS